MSSDRVALRKESVDRNAFTLLLKLSILVALRKESVDRNAGGVVGIIGRLLVALRKESVDRNSMIPLQLLSTQRRSPQGERG